MTYRVVIPAAGQGQRMGAGKNKLFLLLNDTPIIIHTLRIFQNDINCDEIVVVVHKQDQKQFIDLINLYALNKVKQVILGGNSRQSSVFEGLKSIEQEADNVVIIHDGARPFVTLQSIRDVVIAARRFQAAVLAVPVKDTIKRVVNQRVIETLDRSSLWAVQTPQAFRLSLIMNAHIEGMQKNIQATDDASLIETLGGHVQVVDGDYTNIKITTPEDLIIGERLIREREGGKTRMRIGQGYDVHQLVANRPLIIGGVTIPFEKGLTGHSDADVLLHAISDALLGAIAAGDIGKHFPDTDPTYKNVDSKRLLKSVWSMIKQKGHNLENLDAVIIAERPKLAPFIPEMCKVIADILEVEVNQINVKATTTETLGFVGRKEGIAAQAVVLIS